MDDFTQTDIADRGTSGKRETNNGAVLFVFVNDHKMRIQTGYGLEGALPDATCFDIITTSLLRISKQ